MGTLWPSPWAAYGDAVATASGGQRVLDCQGLVLRGPGRSASVPTSPGKKVDTLMWQKSGDSESGPGARPRRGAPLLQITSFVLEGWVFCSLASISSSVKSLHPLDPISRC